MESINSTIIFMIPDGKGGYTSKIYSNISVNIDAPSEKLVVALCEAFSDEVELVPEDCVLAIQVEGDTLNDIKVSKKANIIIMPKYSWQIVRRG